MKTNKRRILIFIFSLVISIMPISLANAQGNFLDINWMSVFQSENNLQVAINQNGSTAIEIYNTTGILLNTLNPTFDTSGILSLNWNASGTRLAVIYVTGATHSNTIIWDIMTSTIIEEQQIDFARFVSWHPTNPDILMVITGQTLVIWHPSNSTLTIYEPTWTDIEYAQWSYNGNYIGILGNTSTFRVIDTQTQEVVFELQENLPLPDKQNFYFSFDFSPSEQYVTLYDIQNIEVEIWNIFTGQLEIVFDSFDTRSQHYEIVRWVDKGIIGFDFRLGKVAIYNPYDGNFEYIVEDESYVSGYLNPSKDSILFLSTEVRVNSPFFNEIEIPDSSLFPTRTPTPTVTSTPLPTATPYYTPTSVVCDVNIPSGDTLSLSTEIINANTSGVPTTICLDGGLYPVTGYYQEFFGKTAFAPITGNITIVGYGATLQRDSSAIDDFRFFGVDAGGTLKLSDLTLRDAILGENAGAGVVNVFGTLQLEQVRFANNNAYNEQAKGGAIYNYNGIVQIDTTVFESNQAMLSSGAIFSDGGSVIVRSSCFVGNTAGDTWSNCAKCRGHDTGAMGRDDDKKWGGGGSDF
jgi:hypothetical protein